jgi:hypothetical protein
MSTQFPQYVPGSFAPESDAKCSLLQDGEEKSRLMQSLYFGVMSITKRAKH